MIKPVSNPGGLTSQSALLTATEMASKIIMTTQTEEPPSIILGKVKLQKVIKKFHRLIKE